MERQETSRIVDQYERELEEERQSTCTGKSSSRNKDNMRRGSSDDSHNTISFDTKLLPLFSSFLAKDDRNILSLKKRFRSHHSEKTTQQCSSGTPDTYKIIKVHDVAVITM